MRLRLTCLFGVISVLIGGCVNTQEMPLAPNIVRLDTHASGALFVGHATDVTMQKAAEATIKIA